MDKKIFVFFFAALLSVGYGEEVSNYDLSRQNKNVNNGFTLRDIWDFLVGGGYGYPGYGGNYPTGSGSGVYPSGPGYQGQYGNGHQGLPGPPGAHPGCPLCDSSVYSYCSYKQAHDSCCCENPAYLNYNCRKTDCKFIYANTCQEYRLISNCCCVDLQKGADPSNNLIG